jgi:hypothetical protein
MAKKSSKISSLKRASSQGKPAVSRLPAQPPVLMGLVSTVALPPGKGPVMSSTPNPVVRGLSSTAKQTQRILRPSSYGSKAAPSRRGRARRIS